MQDFYSDPDGNIPFYISKQPFLGTGYAVMFIAKHAWYRNALDIGMLRTTESDLYDAGLQPFLHVQRIKAILKAKKEGKPLWEKPFGKVALKEMLGSLGFMLSGYLLAFIVFCTRIIYYKMSTLYL